MSISKHKKAQINSLQSKLKSKINMIKRTIYVCLINPRVLVYVVMLMNTNGLK